MDTMNLERFANVLAKAVSELLPDKEITTHDFTKNNGVILKGMIIKDKDNPIAPTIYLNHFYEQNKNGYSIESIVKDIVTTYQENRDFSAQGFDVSSRMHYSKIRDQIRFKVINYDKNIEHSRDIPHRQVLDLMIVYYIDLGLDHSENGRASIQVNNRLLDAWNVTEDELWNTALRNTSEYDNVTIASMTDVIGEVCGEEMSHEEQESMTDGIPMLVVTNRKKVNGAGVIMYPDCLQTIRNKVHSDFYILPSSTHEVLIIPKKSDIHEQELLDMVREVNETGVSEDERLSDNIYCFENNELKLITA